MQFASRDKESCKNVNPQNISSSRNSKNNQKITNMVPDNINKKSTKFAKYQALFSAISQDNCNNEYTRFGFSFASTITADESRSKFHVRNVWNFIIGGRLWNLFTWK